MSKKRIFVLLLFIALALAAYTANRYQDFLTLKYATIFELPTYSENRASVKKLTGNQHDHMADLRAMISAHVRNLEFTPYIRSKASASTVASLQADGYELRGNPVWRVDEPFDWSKDPRNDRNWRFKMNALDHLDALIADYHKNGSLGSLHLFKAGVLDWIVANLVNNQENDFKWYDMSAGIRATRLASLLYFGIMEDLLSDEELRHLLAAMDMHIEALTNEWLLNRGNHGLFQMLGVAAICEVAPVLESCHAAKQFANETFAEIARAQFTTEGMHTEHSSQYHPWAIKTIEQLLGYGYIDEFDTTFLEIAKGNTVDYFYPNGDMTLLGDTGAQHVCSVRDLHPSLEYLCTGGASGEAPTSTSKAHMESGYMVIRDSWEQRPLKNQSYLFFNAAYHSQAHKQSDDLSLLWYEKGMPVLVDSGKYSYDLDKWREYAKSTRAHNTVEIDNGDYSTSRRDAYGSALTHFVTEGSAYLASASVTHYPSMVDRKRMIVMIPKKFLLVVDVLDSEEAHSYRQWFHFHESLDVSLRNGVATITHPGGEIVATGAFAAADEGVSRIVKGQEEPHIQGWVSRSYRQVEPNFALSNEVKSDNTILAAAFTVSDRAPEITLDNEVLTLCHGEAEGIRLDTIAESISIVTCPMQ